MKISEIKIQPLIWVKEGVAESDSIDIRYKVGCTDQHGIYAEAHMVGGAIMVLGERLYSSLLAVQLINSDYQNRVKEAIRRLIVLEEEQ